VSPTEVLTEVLEESLYINDHGGLRHCNARCRKMDR